MLDLNDETDDLVLVENAIVVPPGPKGQGKWQPSGVLDSEGNFVQNSISWSSTTLPVNSEPKLPDAESISEMPGTHMFGGISYGHFGHFIRLCCANRLLTSLPLSPDRVILRPL